MPTPEELARQNIDALLKQCGWLIQDYKKLDLSAGRGIALREVRLKEGRCDYLLLIDRKPVGIIEAKKAGVTLAKVADRPETLADWLGSAGASPAGFGASPNPHPTLRHRLAEMPFAHPYNGEGGLTLQARSYIL